MDHRTGSPPLASSAGASSPPRKKARVNAASSATPPKNHLISSFFKPVSKTSATSTVASSSASSASSSVYESAPSQSSSTGGGGGGGGGGSSFESIAASADTLAKMVTDMSSPSSQRGDSVYYDAPPIASPSARKARPSSSPALRAIVQLPYVPASEPELVSSDPISQDAAQEPMQVEPPVQEAAQDEPKEPVQEPMQAEPKETEPEKPKEPTQAEPKETEPEKPKEPTQAQPMVSSKAADDSDDDEVDFEAFLRRRNQVPAEPSSDKEDDDDDLLNGDAVLNRLLSRAPTAEPQQTPTPEPEKNNAGLALLDEVSGDDMKAPDTAESTKLRRSKTAPLPTPDTTPETPDTPDSADSGDGRRHSSRLLGSGSSSGSTNSSTFPTPGRSLSSTESTPWQRWTPPARPDRSIELLSRLSSMSRMAVDPTLNLSKLLNEDATNSPNEKAVLEASGLGAKASLVRSMFGSTTDIDELAAFLPRSSNLPGRDVLSQLCRPVDWAAALASAPPSWQKMLRLLQKASSPDSKKNSSENATLQAQLVNGGWLRDFVVRHASLGLPAMTTIVSWLHNLVLTATSKSVATSAFKILAELVVGPGRIDSIPLSDLDNWVKVDPVERQHAVSVMEPQQFLDVLARYSPLSLADRQHTEAFGVSLAAQTKERKYATAAFDLTPDRDLELLRFVMLLQMLVFECCAPGLNERHRGPLATIFATVLAFKMDGALLPILTALDSALASILLVWDANHWSHLVLVQAINQSLFGSKGYTIDRSMKCFWLLDTTVKNIPPVHSTNSECTGYMVRRFLCESWMVSLVAANGDDQLNEANLDARIRELQRHLQALQTTPGPFQTLSYSMIHLLVSKFAIVRTTNYQHLYMFCWLLWHSFATYASTTPSKPDKPIIATITSALRSLDGQIQDSFAKSLDRSKVKAILLSLQSAFENLGNRSEASHQAKVDSFFKVV